MTKSEWCVRQCENRGRHLFPSARGRESIRKGWIVTTQRAMRVNQNNKNVGAQEAQRCLLIPPPAL